jgi:hypothetical protein
MNIPLNTPVERENAVKEIISQNSQMHFMVHTSLTEFAQYAYLVRAEHPEYYRIISMFLQRCEDHFNLAVEHTNKALAISKNDKFPIIRAIDEVNQSSNIIMDLVAALSAEGGRTKGDIINEYAKKMVTFAEHGYLPMAKELAKCEKDIAIILMDGTLRKITQDFPNLHTFYQPEVVPSIKNNINAIGRALQETYNNNIVYQADALAQLVTRTNNCIMQWLGQPA